MEDNNKKPREYRDALSGIYIPEWRELTKDERQEAEYENNNHSEEANDTSSSN